MKLIELEERKELQMQILDAIDKFCLQHSIRYSLACGTMLGAVRHGGYIPWDDDIDIYMLREDYNRFEKLFPEVYEGHLELWSLTRTKHWDNIFSKISDNRTVIIEKILTNNGIGINIDIFPIDDVPDNEEDWVSFNKKRRSDCEKSRQYNRKISKERPLWQNILIPFLKLRYLFFNPRKFAEYRNCMVQQYNGKGYKRAFETTSGMFVKEPFPKSLFNELIDIPFENRRYKCFKDYDRYLTDTFGDYMTPPPPEKRKSLHTYDTYWKDE